MRECETEGVCLPEKWKGWKICEKIGEGSCGQVYRVKNKEGDCAAVKVMCVSSDSYEIRALHRLSDCPYIVKIMDSFIQEESDGQSGMWILMEDLKSLAEVLHERPLGEEELLPMMIDLCRGLERCEKEGILHRDIKPENIFLTAEGQSRFGDFGSAGKRETLQRDHRIQGTFSYMAPEIFHGEAQDNRADLYSLGMVFYRIMNRGREPFVPPEKQIVGYKDREAALERRMNGEALPPPVDASPEFARILLKTCAYRPEKRYQDAGRLRRVLEKFRRHSKNRVLRALGSWSLGKRAAALAAVLWMVFAVCLWGWWKSPLAAGINQENGFYYTLNRGGTLTVEGEGVMKVSIEPQEWEQYSAQVKKLVFCGDITRIEAQFHICSSLEKVILPEGLESLGNSVFWDCGNLKNIVFPSSLKEIGNGAFQNCRNLRSLSFPENLESIDDAAFGLCSNLKNMKFPKSLKKIGKNVFSGTAWMEDQCSAGEYVMINDILVGYSGEEEKLSIPEELGIRSIAGDVFGRKENLRSVILPDTVEEIGEDAFQDCTALTQAVLSENLKEIPEGLFDGCSSLKQFDFPESTKRIGSFAFRNCVCLEEIHLPAFVESIGDSAFEGTGWYEKKKEEDEFIVLDDFLLCWQGDGETLEIPSNLGIRRIADYAIAWKEKLTRVVIPEGIISLGSSCFFYCWNLESIEFPKSLTQFGRGAMAATKWMEERQPPEGGVPVLVNGIDVSY